ncbi:MAG TPA: DUF1508 domain-containing protein [Flavobacterium sp.]|jgi:hypothetical protein
MGAFVISKRFNGDFKFVFTSRKGKVIYTSKGYSSKDACEKDIEVLRQKVTLESFQRAKAANGKFFFKIGINEEIFAVSRKYSTELRMKKGIDEIIKYSSGAEVLDFSENADIFSDFA